MRRHYKEQLKKYMGKGQLQCVPGEILLISLFNHKRHEGYKNEGPPRAHIISFISSLTTWQIYFLTK